MQHIDLKVTLIENEKDAQDAIPLVGIKPRIGDLIMKGCIYGQSCQATLVRPSYSSPFMAIETELRYQLESEHPLFVMPEVEAAKSAPKSNKRKTTVRGKATPRNKGK